MAQPLLEGEVRQDDSVRLRREIAGLEQELQQAKDEAVTAKKAAADSVQAIRALRKSLEPFYTALRMIYGEISRVDVGEADAPVESNGTSPKSAVWESWKNELGGKQAAFIEVLQKYGAMTSTQIRIATKTGISTVPQIIYKLNKLGLLRKDGDKYRLKEL